jgi:8-oxo-dGTP pyrophosphatase MutT (NUDIX family)
VNKSSKLVVVYALEAAPETYVRSVYLMGPSPQQDGDASWRPAALEALDQAGYEGVVFVPELRSYRPKSGITPDELVRLVAWQSWCQEAADALLMWLPASLPGRHTFSELGKWASSGKLVIGLEAGRADAASVARQARAGRIPYVDSLSEAAERIVTRLEQGARRTGGDRTIPLQVWKLDSFQQWYQAQASAGNRIEQARLVWTLRPRNGGVFFWILHVELYIAAEGRVKHNEVVLSRPDIAAVVLYQRAPQLDDCLVVLVREARTPASNPTGYVWEIPGGSSFKPGLDPLDIVSEEIVEEVGLEIDPSRLWQHEHRQLLATISAHHGHVFSAELTNAEVEQLRAGAGVPLGVLADTERTYPEVLTLGEIRRQHLVDWANLGMILQILA